MALKSIYMRAFTCLCCLILSSLVLTTSGHYLKQQTYDSEISPWDVLEVQIPQSWKAPITMEKRAMMRLGKRATMHFDKRAMMRLGK
ncbi:unnamed protein product [Cylicocyclus nassatus]|uniref:Uncharacterized protein n=1 Tax=Cylicocyclus nassatus TaxID=53992 RepID=A0AA36HFE1_CYLNA|nr:unnamed protein product [Cylicocyclus nassatus]